MSEESIFPVGTHLGILIEYKIYEPKDIFTVFQASAFKACGQVVKKKWIGDTQIDILRKWLQSFRYFPRGRMPEVKEIPRVLEHLKDKYQLFAFTIEHEWQGRNGVWIKSFGRIGTLNLIPVIPLPELPPEPELEPEPVFTYSKKGELYDNRNGIRLYRISINGKRQGIGELRTPDGRVLGFIRNNRRMVIYKTFEAAMNGK